MGGINITSFFLTILIATIIGIAGLLGGLKCIGLMVPKWNLQDALKKEKVTNSGIIIAVYIFALAMVISYAVY